MKPTDQSHRNGVAVLRAVFAYQPWGSRLPEPGVHDRRRRRKAAKIARRRNR